MNKRGRGMTEDRVRDDRERNRNRMIKSFFITLVVTATAAERCSDFLPRTDQPRRSDPRELAARWVEMGEDRRGWVMMGEG